jgi:CheY-like chemotaxis protein
VSQGQTANPGAESADRIVLEICDNGIGMTEETRKRCLEPFFSTKGEHGTGLGLSMVYGVMQRHQGNIEIESRPGQGTLIRLLFPMRQPMSAANLPPETSSVSEPRRILYIDDEPVLRELLRELLEVDGHRVEIGDGGEAGIEVFRSALRQGKAFDLVITDLGMPRLDGREVARLVKAESPTTPVALLTGWAALMKNDESLSAHVDVILPKPPRLNDLRHLVSQLPLHS